MQETIIEVIERAMEERGITDMELSTASGVHITLIRRYLKGETRIGVKNARTVAEALGLTVHQVLYGEAA